MVIEALAPGTFVKLRKPGKGERGDWKVTKPLWHPQSGLAYELAHVRRGNQRIVLAARVRLRPGERARRRSI